MKVNRLSKENDPCETSIEFLVERCEQFFERNPQLKSESRYYPESLVHAPFDSEGLTDVVLFGNAYKTIFQSGNWPFEKLRLWVLSHSLKEFFENEFSQGEFKVNLIPRSEILKVDPTKDCAGSGPVQYIYAGRLSFQKNLKLLLATFEELKKSKPDSELHLFGDFDDTIHENLGRRVRESYRDELENFRSDFTSNKEVYFHGKVGRDDWINREWSNPTFISLSTFLSEDFGVSASQAAAEGWPIILSQFGGHRDVEASKIFHIGSELCLNDHLPDNLLKAVGKLIASNIQEATFYAHFPNIEKTNHSFSLEVLDKHRRRWAKHFGTSVSQLGYEYLTTFADHPTGRSFLNEFYHYQAGRPPLLSFVGFDFDHQMPEEKVCERVAEVLDSHPSTCSFFLNSRDLLLKDSIKNCLKSQKLFLLNDTGDAEKWRSFLIEKLQIESSKIEVI